MLNLQIERFRCLAKVKDQSVIHVRYHLRLFLPCCDRFFPFVPVLDQVKTDRC